MVIVTSSATNYFYRDRLRQQLGQKYFILFLLGTSYNNDTEADIREESVMFGDILQLNIEEEYLALPYKVLAGMVWSKR